MRNLDCDLIQSEINTILKYRYRGALGRVAEIIGIAYETANDISIGRIKLKLPFIHAAVIATDDSDIKRFLEPDGYRLVKSTLPTPDKETLEQELLDNSAYKAARERVFLDPKSTRSECIQAMNDHISEIKEDWVKLCLIRKWKK